MVILLRINVVVESYSRCFFFFFFFFFALALATTQTLFCAPNADTSHSTFMWA